MNMIWKLKKGADRRVKAGHPWVFSHELAEIPRGFTSGSPVELQDDQGRFVARGYGNPESKITFRALTFDSREKNPMAPENILLRILECWESRRRLGFKASCRLAFSEADRLSGLIIDYYRGKVGEKPVQVFAVQIGTAGMDRSLGNQMENFFRQLVGQAVERRLTAIDWDSTAVVLRNDVKSRELEGLEEEPVRFIKSIREADFTKFPIELNAATDDGLVQMNCDLFQGQKTGFFLDQTANIETVCRLVEKDPAYHAGQTVRVLDLCCYVGHWSTQLARVLKKKGCHVEVTLVDVSAPALAFAKQNVEREGASVTVMTTDVLKPLPGNPTGFDIVIADPPAFIKAKKDIPTGQHAYLKMNTTAFRVAKAKSWVVSCSCSGHFTEDLLQETLAKSLRRNRMEARCVARGGPAPDHPGRLSFPDGMYLKMFVHQTEAAAEPAVVEAAGADAD